MKIGRYVVTSMLAAGLIGGTSAVSASSPDVPGVPAQLVVTTLRAPGGERPKSLEAGDLTVMQGHTPMRVVKVEQFAGDLADMQLFLLLDDSTRSSSLGLHFRELKTFVESLPASTEVAVGYMQNGTFVTAQAFTADHEKVAAAFRLPFAVPGANGSPYFALSDLVKHWPSRQATGRRAVLMLTDGVDRYYPQPDLDDPYVQAATHDALKRGVLVYSIYLRGAGSYGRGGWATNLAQSRLIQVSEATGGNAYFEGFSDPVSISPFLDDLQDRLENQYQVTVDAGNQKGFEPVKLRTELNGLKVDGPTQIYVP